MTAPDLDVLAFAVAYAELADDRATKAANVIVEELTTSLAFGGAGRMAELASDARQRRTWMALRSKIMDACLDIGASYERGDAAVAAAARVLAEG